MSLSEIVDDVVDEDRSLEILRRFTAFGILLAACEAVAGKLGCDDGDYGFKLCEKCVVVVNIRQCDGQGHAYLQLTAAIAKAKEKL